MPTGVQGTPCSKTEHGPVRGAHLRNLFEPRPGIGLGPPPFRDILACPSNETSPTSLPTRMSSPLGPWTVLTDSGSRSGLSCVPLFGAVDPVTVTARCLGRTRSFSNSTAYASRRDCSPRRRERPWASLTFQEQELRPDGGLRCLVRTSGQRHASCLTRAGGGDAPPRATVAIHEARNRPPFQPTIGLPTKVRLTAPAGITGPPASVRCADCRGGNRGVRPRARPGSGCRRRSCGRACGCTT